MNWAGRDAGPTEFFAARILDYFKTFENRSSKSCDKTSGKRKEFRFAEALRLQKSGSLHASALNQHRDAKSNCDRFPACRN